MLYYICHLSDDGQWVGLRSTHDENYAQSLLDYYSEEMPHAYVDILTADELLGIEMLGFKH
jgi:hypothetical protein